LHDLKRGLVSRVKWESLRISSEANQQDLRIEGIS